MERERGRDRDRKKRTNLLIEAELKKHYIVEFHLRAVSCGLSVLFPVSPLHLNEI